jgi:hypothetical protein
MNPPWLFAQNSTPRSACPHEQITLANDRGPTLSCRSCGKRWTFVPAGETPRYCPEDDPTYPGMLDNRGWSNALRVALIDETEEQLRRGRTMGVDALLQLMSKNQQAAIARDIGLGDTSPQIRDEVIAKVGMMADARTPEMHACYDAAVGRAGDHPDEHRRMRHYKLIYEAILAKLVAETACRAGRTVEAWILAERECVMREINRQRQLLAYDPVGIAVVERAECMAVGHTDYVSKYARAAVDLVLRKEAT